MSDFSPRKHSSRNRGARHLMRRTGGAQNLHDPNQGIKDMPRERRLKKPRTPKRKAFRQQKPEPMPAIPRFGNHCSPNCGCGRSADSASREWHWNFGDHVPPFKSSDRRLPATGVGREH